MKMVFRPAALAMSLLAASCGGSGHAHPDAVETAFATRAAAVCAEALDAKRAQGPFPYPTFNPTQPDTQKLPLVASFLEETATTFTNWHAQMQHLGEPRRGRDAWHDLLAAIATHAQLTRDQITAAHDGDTKRFADDYQQGVDTQSKLLDAAKAAGVPSCARVDR
jgi:hypothetical protein